MGLSIQYALSLPPRWTIDRVVETLGKLSHRCRQHGINLLMPLQIMTPEVIQDIVAKGREHELAWELNLSGRHVRWRWDLDGSRARLKPDDEFGGTSYFTKLHPSQAVVVTFTMPEGCEDLVIPLSCWPSRHVAEPPHHLSPAMQELCPRTTLWLPGPHRWRGSAFCKTEYANDPELGGTTNFLVAHLSAILVLDQAKALGVMCDVRDEGGYWDHRSIPALLRAARTSAEGIEALRAAICKATKGRLGTPVTPRLQHDGPPNADKAAALTDRALDLMKLTNGNYQEPTCPSAPSTPSGSSATPSGPAADHLSRTADAVSRTLLNSTT
jgi:hypothetical protein